jgi:hypothetical protein
VLSPFAERSGTDDTLISLFDASTAPCVCMSGARRVRWAPWWWVFLLLSAGGWSATPHGVRASEQVSETVVVCTVDGRVHALDSSSGDAKWSVELGDPLLSSWSLTGTSKHPNPTPRPEPSPPLLKLRAPGDHLASSGAEHHSRCASAGCLAVR